MKKQLMALLATLNKLRDRADDLSQSDNDATSDKYSDVYGMLDVASDEIQTALDRLDED